MCGVPEWLHYFEFNDYEVKCVYQDGNEGLCDWYAYNDFSNDLYDLIKFAYDHWMDNH